MSSMSNEATRRAIAAEIRAELARQDKGTRELARFMGVDHGTVSFRLRGIRSFRAEELSAIADWLGVPVAQFVPKASTEVAG
jgi:transcriptional regulator with XRE-family HTH domain